jgi:hypothetical protein
MLSLPSLLNFTQYSTGGGKSKGAAMVNEEDRMAHVMRRAYALAATGLHRDAMSVEQTLIAEGYPEARNWLARPGIRDALEEICKTSREREGKA